MPVELAIRYPRVCGVFLVQPLVLFSFVGDVYCFTQSEAASLDSRLQGFKSTVTSLRAQHAADECVPKFWAHRTKIYYFCDRSVREKAWRSRKRVEQAT